MLVAAAAGRPTPAFQNCLAPLQSRKVMPAYGQPQTSAASLQPRGMSRAHASARASCDNAGNALRQVIVLRGARRVQDGVRVQRALLRGACAAQPPAPGRWRRRVGPLHGPASRAWAWGREKWAGINAGPSWRAACCGARQRPVSARGVRQRRGRAERGAGAAVQPSRCGSRHAARSKLRRTHRCSRTPRAPADAVRHALGRGGGNEFN